MGVGLAVSKSGRTYVVVSYDPPGNLPNKFHLNVYPAGTSNKNINGSIYDLLINDDIVICSDSDVDTFLKENLMCHNVLRKRHRVPPVSYDQVVSK